MTRDLTPPPLHGPSAKEKRYDRQLRLWAASGQAALENAHLLLINSGPGVIGIEVLKNLILPGIGQYTIVDPALVEEGDLGINFFLDESSVGKPRAEETCKFLQELNPDVRGHYILDPLGHFITQQDSLRPFSHIIVVAPVPTEVLTTVVGHAQRFEVPVFFLHSVGFYATLSIHLPPTFPIVDTHPEPLSAQDLRLLKPWPALSEFAAQKTTRLEQMDDHEHGHVPYILLLLYYLERWKATHSGAVPSSYREKSEFRELVRSGMRTNNAEGGEENYEEAIAAVLKSLNEPSAPSTVRDVFASSECAALLPDVRPLVTNVESSLHLSKRRRITPTPSNGDLQPANFWIIARAISVFHEKNGVLPLPGAVPDMKAQSKDYIALQNVYKKKAREDVEEVLSTVRELERKLGRDAPPVDTAEVEAFCKNAAHIKLIRGRPFQLAGAGQKVVWGDRARWAASSLTDETSKILLYIAFLAWDAFCATHPLDGRQPTTPSPPGLQSSHVDTDTAKLSGIAQTFIADLLAEAGTTLETSEYDEVRESVGQICAELCRAGGAELHNIAALAGGLVAQEVIKVVTKQYIPVDNTCLFDGVRSESAVIRV